MHRHQLVPRARQALPEDSFGATARRWAELAPDHGDGFHGWASAALEAAFQGYGGEPVSPRELQVLADAFVLIEAWRRNLGARDPAMAGRLRGEGSTVGLAEADRRARDWAGMGSASSIRQTRSGWELVQGGDLPAMSSRVLWRASTREACLAAGSFLREVESRPSLKLFDGTVSKTRIRGLGMRLDVMSPGGVLPKLTRDGKDFGGFILDRGQVLADYALGRRTLTGHHAISKEYMGRGVGHDLMDFVESTTGCAVVPLGLFEAGDLAMTDRAMAFYAKRAALGAAPWAEPDVAERLAEGLRARYDYEHLRHLQGDDHVIFALHAADLTGGTVEGTLPQSGGSRRIWAALPDGRVATAGGVYERPAFEDFLSRSAWPLRIVEVGRETARTLIADAGERMTSALHYRAEQVLYDASVIHRIPEMPPIRMEAAFRRSVAWVREEAERRLATPETATSPMAP